VTKRNFKGFEDLTAVVVKSPSCHMLHAGFLPASFFDLEDGGDIFLQNVS
jgi:hypothetical protein